jgi:hypothetical protein
MNIDLKHSGSYKKNLVEIINSFKSSEFDSPKRSTVPFLHFWSEPEKRLGELSDQLGIKMGEDVTLDFEHKVPVQKGTGTASHTDLMIIGNDLRISIEAKFTESRYATCSKWLESGKKIINRKAVLDGWLDLINEACETSLDRDVINLIPYQMIHRLASACLGNPKHKILIYHVFNTGKKKEFYEQDLASLKNLISSNSGIRFYLEHTEFKPSKEWQGLKINWDLQKRSNMDKAVIDLLFSDSIGHTSNYQLSRI